MQNMQISNKKIKQLLGLIVLLFALGVFPVGNVLAKNPLQQENTCAVYFTGTGCPHCAKVNTFFEDLFEKYPNLVIIKYEIYQQQENAPLLSEYNNSYGSGLGIPLLIFGKDKFLHGDVPIIERASVFLDQNTANPCPLADGKSIAFEGLNIASLPGRPKIATAVGCELGGTQNEEPTKDEDLTLTKIFSLAAADAVNPCALSILTAMLLAIMTYNPKKRRNILLAGLAFTTSVFVMYTFYGLVIIRFFQLVKALTSIRLFLYKFLGVVAIVLGLLDIREFLLGHSACHVVPKVGKLLSKITSPTGAFAIGAFVTVFLLPCTIGPYVIAGGILSTISILKTLPWLALYNLIFVLPMVGITIVTYFGFSTVENISGWQDRNLKYLNLAAGLIISVLGLAMLLGWV